MGFALQPFSRHSCLVRHWQQHMEKVFETHVKGRKHKNWERNFNPANNDVNQKKCRLHVKLELEFYTGSITVYQSIPFSLYEISLFTSYAPGP